MGMLDCEDADASGGTPCGAPPSFDGLHEVEQDDGVPLDLMPAEITTYKTCLCETRCEKASKLACPRDRSYSQCVTYCEAPIITTCDLTGNACVTRCVEEELAFVRCVAERPQCDYSCNPASERTFIEGCPTEEEEFLTCLETPPSP